MPLLFSCQQRDYSVKCARSTPHSLCGGGLSAMLKRKLNNLGVWARQKFPSVICQLKPTPGRHFACSSKMTVVGSTWRDYALRVLGCIFCPFLQTLILPELAQEQQRRLSKPSSAQGSAAGWTAFFSGAGKELTLPLR